jgi:hypothetical protein
VTGAVSLLSIKFVRQKEKLVQREHLPTKRCAVEAQVVIWQSHRICLFVQAGDNHHFHPTCARCTKCGDPFGDGEEMYLQGKYCICYSIFSYLFIISGRN